MMDSLKNKKDFADFGLSLVANILWNIWKSRNELTFRNISPNPTLVITKSTEAASESLQSLSKGRSVPNQGQTLKQRRSWRPPPQDRLKCNVDAAFCGKRNIAAVAAVIRDSQGKMVAGKASKVACASSLLAEALAVRHGLLLASSCLCNSILMESDNIEVIEACRSKSSRAEIATVVNDIKNLKCSFLECGFVWTPREANEAAHHIARLLLVDELNCDWLSSHPSILDHSLRKDSPPLY